MPATPLSPTFRPKEGHRVALIGSGGSLTLRVGAVRLDDQFSKTKQFPKEPQHFQRHSVTHAGNASILLQQMPLPLSQQSFAVEVPTSYPLCLLSILIKAPFVHAVCCGHSFMRNYFQASLPFPVRPGFSRLSTIFISLRIGAPCLRRPTFPPLQGIQVLPTYADPPASCCPLSTPSQPPSVVVREVCDPFHFFSAASTGATDHSISRAASFGLSMVGRLLVPPNGVLTNAGSSCRCSNHKFPGLFPTFVFFF